MKSLLPLEIKYSPIKALALIPFEKTPDIIYRGLELQYIDGKPYGKGYRILAYRNDNFVDVYDDISLNYLKDEEFAVAENGLHIHTQISINNVQFCKEGNNQRICFEFEDIQGRQIMVNIQENTKKKSAPMNLLAPIGLDSQKPNYLPVFFMYDFDFVRRKNSVAKCSIDGKEMELDRFPIPMNGQARLFTRYSNECELFEFANTDAVILQEVELDEDKTYRKDNVDYIFERENILKKVVVHCGENDVQICFSPGLDINKSGAGAFTIEPRHQMGYLQGKYVIQSGKNAVIEMIPEGGWVANADSFLTKMILGKKSVFCNWSKKYKYNSTINMETKEMKSYWVNGNIQA